jgi:hypothetical protein
MRRLSMHQLVAIGLDNEEDNIECRVVSVNGSAALLRQTYRIPRSARLRLATGALGHLVFQYQGSLVALRGVAHAPEDSDEGLVFAVVDGVELPERRTAERVSVALRAIVWALDGHGSPDASCGQTTTANVSSSGALIERRDHLATARQLRLELFLRDGDAPLCCEAFVARETPTHLGVHFTTMAEQDRIRLGVALLRHGHERAAA